MDEDHMLDIYDYFKESTTDDIEEARGSPAGTHQVYLGYG